MNLVADESLHGAITARLRADGHAVHAIAATDSGVPDTDVLAIAVNRQALLLTQDKDFGELIFRRGLPHAGIVLIRLVGLAPADRAQLVSDLIRDHAIELADAFTVVSDSGVRIRRQSSP